MHGVRTVTYICYPNMRYGVEKCCLPRHIQQLSFRSIFTAGSCEHALYALQCLHGMNISV
jgi:hypothetical protein